MDELEISARVASGERHPERVEHEICAQMTCELPANDPAWEGVDHEAEEDHCQQRR